MILSHVIRDSHREEGAVDIVVEDGVITGDISCRHRPHPGGTTVSSTSMAES